MMFSDPKLLATLENLFSTSSDRFDDLLSAAGLDPKTDLVGADLRGADFGGSVLDGWNLSRCDLTGASFVGARVRDLTTTGAIGLDLSGAESLRDSAHERTSSDSISWLCDQIERGANGAQRWPYLQRLLRDYQRDDRTWVFLHRHLKRERVGKYVSAIVEAWSNLAPRTQADGNQLRFELLERNGNPYVTVRSRLLRELDSRIGASERLLELARSLMKNEGFLTSGITAIRILGTTFAGNPTAALALESLIGQIDGFLPKGEAVRALLTGFDSPSTRALIERAISNAEDSDRHRVGMVHAYCTVLANDEDAILFADYILRNETVPQLRATALRTLAGNSAALSADVLRKLALSDRDRDVRSVAIGFVEDFETLIRIAEHDNESSARAAAVRRLEELDQYDPAWLRKVLDRDTADVVRSAALDVLVGVVPLGQLRDSLEKEIARPDPSYAAARAANFCIEAWPNDKTLLSLVAEMLKRLPQNTGGWNSTLRTRLRERGFAV